MVPYWDESRGEMGCGSLWPGQWVIFGDNTAIGTALGLLCSCPGLSRDMLSRTQFGFGETRIGAWGASLLLF